MDGHRVRVGDAENAVVHDAQDAVFASILAGMQYPDFPVPMGIFRAIEKNTYEDILANQREEQIAKHGRGDLDQLLKQGHTWDIS